MNAAAGVIEARLYLSLDTALPAIAASGNFGQLLGYTPDSFLSGAVSFWDRLHAHDQDIADAMRSAEPSDTPTRCNIRLRHANGRIICIKCHYRKVISAGDPTPQLELTLQDAKSLPRTFEGAATMADFQAVMEISDDFIYFKDRNHVFTGASQSLVALCQSVTHWQEFLGLTDYDVFAEPYADIYYSLEKRVFTGGVEVKEIQKTVTKEGTNGWVDNRKYPIFGKAGDIVGLYGIARDISDLKRAQGSLESFFQQPLNLNLIADLSGIIVQANRKWTEVFGYEIHELIGHNFFELVHPDDNAATLQQMANLARGETVIGFRNRYRKTNGDYRLLQWSASLSIGDNCVYAVADDITDMDQMQKELARYLAKIERSMMQTVEVTTNMCEMRDPYNAGHQKRVATLAVAIGQELRMSDSQLNGLKVAGLVHDVGMFMIPTEIALKPGKLSDIEFNLVKGHTEAGYELLKNVDFPWPVATVALQHHERMDGSGYPHGLVGEASAIESRIIAVADVVAAMTAHRPFRVALTIDDALDEIRRGRGRLYDPRVVDACLNLPLTSNL